MDDSADGGYNGDAAGGEDVEKKVKFCREEDPLVKRGWVKPEGLVWWVAEETFTAP